MKLADDIFPIICSFLQPLELCRARYLSKRYHKLCDKWLTKTFHSIHLQDHGCPNCGKLLYTDTTQKWEIENDPTFYDLLYGNIFEIEQSRLECVIDVLNNNGNDQNITRSRLLCEECDEDEIELSKVRLRCKGNREYHVHLVQCSNSVYSWAFLSLTQNSQTYWNQLRAFIASSYGGYDDDEEYDEDDEDDEDIKEITEYIM